MFEVGTDILKDAGRTHDGGRMRFVYSVFAIIFAVFIIKTLYLAVQGTDRARRGVGADSWAVTRADIVDRNGDILAKNVISGHIVLRPGAVKDKDGAAALIHSVMPNDYSVSQAFKLLDSGKKFIYLKKLATEGQRKAISDAKIVGLDTETVQWRRYPKRRLFSHAVGFTGSDGTGLEGVERVYDAYLRENNDPLRLSLDSRIQSAFYEQLSIAMHKFQARAAMGMLMNSRTGEMIAMVSLPDFDPENLELDPVVNRKFQPLRGVFEMGSIFKIFNTALAIETGIGLLREYVVNQPFKIPDKFGRTAATIRDVASLKPPRTWNVEEILVNSCNVGSSQISLDLPAGAQTEFFQRLKFDSRLELEFGKSERPLFHKSWGPVERATASFGHGIAITPMHLLLGVNAMTNGGIYILPTVLKRSVGAVRGERVISGEMSSELRRIMLRVNEETSGKNARVAGINIGGKTATAEKRTAYNSGNRKLNLTSYTAVFPIESPQYVMLVVLDEPKGIEETWGLRTAAWNAAPTAGKIMNEIMPLLFQ